MSEIKVDTLTGKTSAGNVTVTSEGGAATFQLQQGLVKAWAKGSFYDTTLDDSFSMSSVTDNGTGDSTFTVSNAFNNANYAVAMTRGRSASNYTTSKAGGMVIADNQTLPTTTAIRARGMDTDATEFDFDIACVSFMGDLA